MKLAVFLLVLVGAVHFGTDWLSLLFAQQETARKALFYIARGIEGVALFAAVAMVTKHRAVIAVCCLGVFEEGMTSACRVSKPISQLPGVELFSGLCGREWYFVGLAALGLVALGLAYEMGRSRHGTKRA